MLLVEGVLPFFEWWQRLPGHMLVYLFDTGMPEINARVLFCTAHLLKRDHV